MTWLDSITDSMAMNLSKLREIGEDREAGVLQSIRSQRVGHDSATEQQQLADFKNRKIILEYPSGLKGL